MSGILLMLLLLADDAAVRKAIGAFNQMHERASVLTSDARIPDFARCWEQETSQMYFEATGIHWVAPDTARVEARGSRYGIGGKQTAPAVFVLKREGAGWKIESLRVWDGCLEIRP
jgi:hypothetical protein